MTPIAIVGLGNPEPEYVGTRHNVGFWLLDNLAGKYSCKWKKARKFHSFTTFLKTWTRPALLVKPLTYVNESGAYLKPLLSYHGCNLNDLVVVHDDMAFDVGLLKISAEKGAGGHNGIKNIIKKVGSNFIRFRIGIGAKTVQRSMTSHVLGKFSPEEVAVMTKNFDFFSESLQHIVDKGAAHAMNLSNKRNKPTHG